MRQPIASVSVILALAIAVTADAPHVYAIRGARIVTASGSEIADGTVVIRNGLIDSVGATAAVPDAAHVIEGKGLVVYPGLIDMGTTAGLDVPAIPRPQNARTLEEVERWKRGVILRPQLQAANHVRADATELGQLAAAGITTALAIPRGEVFRGQSALLRTKAPEDDPQIGAVADPRAGLFVVRTPVALHVAFSRRPPGESYPVSLMGVIAFVRQSFLDAQHYARTVAAGSPRPTPDSAYDPALAALQPAVEGKLPVVFDANAMRDILRALALASEFKLDPIVAGGHGASGIAADLKAANARVLYRLDYPARPRTLAPDADEALRTVRERAEAPKAPAALEKAGVLFAFQSEGLRDPKDFVRNAARAVQAGLPAAAAVRALTVNAAKIAGIADRLGSVEKGKTANLIVVDRDLFDERAAIKHVFIDGRLTRIDPAPERRERERATP
jgi:imidazolonepropionase-like amidohydrolase